MSDAENKYHLTGMRSEVKTDNLYNYEQDFWHVERGEDWCVLTCLCCGHWIDMQNIPGEAESQVCCPGCGRPMKIHAKDVHPLYQMTDCKRKCSVKCEHLEEREDEDGSCGYCKITDDRFVGLTGQISRNECDCVALGLN